MTIRKHDAISPFIIWAVGIFQVMYVFPHSLTDGVPK